MCGGSGLEGRASGERRRPGGGEAIASENKEAVRKIAEKTARFIEYVWPKLERRGGVPETPMNRKAKGKSNPPMGDHAFDVLEANANASRYLRFHLEVFENGDRRSSDGVRFSEVLKAARYDVGLIDAWREGRTEEDRNYRRAFNEVCRAVAKGVLFVHGEKGADAFEVVVNPHEEQQRQKTREAQKRATAYTDRLIVGRLEELEKGGLGREEAKRALAKDPDNTWSYWRVERAIVAENKTRKDSC